MAVLASIHVNTVSYVLSEWKPLRPIPWGKSFYIFLIIETPCTVVWGLDRAGWIGP